MGSEVGNMISKDIDAGDVVTYRITSGNNDRAFNILFKQGTLKVTEDLDFESVKKYTLGVQVTDTGGNKASATATIRITDVNEAPFFPGAQDGSVDYTRNIDEVDFDGYDSNGPITSHPTGGRVVLGGGRACQETTDAGDMSSMKYSLSDALGTGKDLFTIDEVTGVLSTTTDTGKGRV